MEPEFITYQKFNDPALALGLVEQLKSKGIEYQYEQISSGFEPSMVMSNAPIDFIVKVRSIDFEKVNQLLEENELQDLENIGTDYYLFSFTNEELLELIARSDEWSPFDVVLARKILAEKGKVLTDDDIADITYKRIEDLKRPDPPQTLWIIIGYIVAFLGGLLGIFIGWHLMSFKKTLPDGERVFEYSKRDRKHGERIFYIGIIVLFSAIIYKIGGIFYS